MALNRLAVDSAPSRATTVAHMFKANHPDPAVCGIYSINLYKMMLYELNKNDYHL